MTSDAPSITDREIDACGFRMFQLHEIASCMVMDRHPSGGEYVVLGNKREQMAMYGNAVTPPVTEVLLGRIFDVLGGGGTFKDLFCGAGGSSIGATNAGGELVLGLNHWAKAIETHATNFPDADHDCADVSALTTSQIRRYPDSDVLLASPECTNHSLAKGARRRKPQVASLFADGPAGDDEQDRSRATMWDVVRFAEQKLLKGNPYKAMIVENVVDAYRWGAGDNGGLFEAWRLALTNLGYESEIVWLNSMFCPPTPQSRDRMYVVFWLKGVRRPDLSVCPPSWCLSCEKIVDGQQAWKRPDRPHETREGKPVGARYGVQYLYSCPSCTSVVLPGAFPAAAAIDWSLDAPVIGDRDRPLAVNTRERIRRGLDRLAREPFAIRLLQGGVPKPLTLPLVTLTQRHDMAMVLPVAGNTFERTPGNRARRADLRPMDTIAATDSVKALVVPNRAHGRLRDAGSDVAPTILTGGTVALVRLRRNGDAKGVEEPSATLAAGGNHHGLVMRNNGSESASGWECTSTDGPTKTLTGRCHQSLVVPYGSQPHGAQEPAKTLMTHDRLALVIPPMGGVAPRLSDRDALPTQTTTTRAGLVELPR